MRLTLHAQERLNGRLGTLTNVHEVMDACNLIADREQYAEVVVKKLGTLTVIAEDADPMKCSKGDQIVAICRDGHVTTVMLRKSWSRSDRYGRTQ